MSGSKTGGHDTFVSGPTLVDSARPSPVNVVDTTLHEVEFEKRYRFRSPLGEGGMGAIGLYSDAHIGRDVAVKTMHARLGQESQAVARFLREARVQGQLEHPSIVPVHDLDVAGDGNAYFTMKRVRGTTLADVLDRARASGAIEPPFSLHKLLSAFVSVCLAIDFAHRRRVIHRDLKPANIMLGDFGEVYVLDWGIAKVEGEAEPTGDLATTGERAPVGVSDVATRAGTLLGTPGYMAPEQLRGEVVTERSDVYALGAILFEILSLRTLHEGTIPQIAVSTLAAKHARPSERAPELAIAPELEAMCERAIELDPAKRYGSVRELSDAIERYLEGDRDLERRRTLAVEHVEAARIALDETNHSGDGFVRSRTHAMRALGRALALDPDNRSALTMLVKLLGDLPPEEPPEVRAAIREGGERTVRAVMPAVARLSLVWFAFIPLAWWMGIRDLAACAWVLVPMALSGALSWMEVMRKGAVRRSVQLANIVLTCTATVAIARLFGPYVIVPTLAATYAVSLQTHPERWPRRLAIVMCCAVVITAIVLEATGIAPRTTFFSEGAIVIRAPGTLREWPTIAFFVISSMTLIIAPCLFIFRVREELDEAERRLLLHTWYLEQLLPAT